MMPAARKHYVPQVRKMVGRPGWYTVNSEKYTYLLYEVDAINGTCTCEGHATWGKICKHIKVAQMVRAALAPKMTAPVVAAAPAPEHINGWEYTPASADLMDIFGL